MNARRIVPASSQWNSRSGRSQTLTSEDAAFVLAGVIEQKKTRTLQEWPIKRDPRFSLLWCRMACFQRIAL